MTSEKDLFRAALACEKAEFAAAAAKEARDILIRKAAGEGWTHAELARVTSLTRGRIGQIAVRR